MTSGNLIILALQHNEITTSHEHTAKNWTGTNTVVIWPSSQTKYPRSCSLIKTITDKHTSRIRTLICI